MNNPYLELDRAMLGDIYTTTEPMDNLIMLCDEFGSRTPGTPDERAAADFLRGKLEAYGLENARLEPFQHNAWRRGPTSLHIEKPFQKEIPCIALPYCPPTDLTAPLVLLPDGGPASFERAAERLKGGIAAVSSAPPSDVNRVVHRTEMYERSALAGAVGFVFIGMYEGRGPETGSVGGDREGLIPGFSIGHEDAEFLRRQEARLGPLTARLRADCATYPSESWNIVAEIPGETDEIVMIGSHHDGHDIAQGAMDPASGVVSVLEAARVLAKHAKDKLRRTARFIFWSCEEIGLTGAYRHAEATADELDKVRFLLNCDAAGGSGGKGVILNQLKELEPLFEAYEKQMGDAPFGQKTHAFSDHYPYFLRGVPTAYVGNPRGRFTGRGWGHTAYDTVDKLELRHLWAASALAARIVLRAASEENWPAQRRAPEEIEEIMRQEPDLVDMRAVSDAYDQLCEERQANNKGAS